MLTTPLSAKSQLLDFVETPQEAQISHYHTPEESFIRHLAQHRAMGTPLLLVDLQPIEKNFFLGVHGTRISRTTVVEYYERYRSEGEKKANEWLDQHFRTLPGYLELKKSLAEQLSFIKEDPSLVHYYQSSRYDYFQELKLQYQKFLRHTGNAEAKIYLTIQGLHSLGTGYPEDDDLREGDTAHNTCPTEIKKRIRQLKREEPMSEGNFWMHTPLALAMAGNFHNAYCGHTSTLPEAWRLLYDQRKGKDLGILQDSAFEIMRELLGLDENLESTGSKRILIDVRHMSPASRMLYYQNIIKKHNDQPDHQEKKIPILASHVGYSGIDSLDEMIRNASEGKEKEGFRSKGFLAWGCNLSDEDVIAIFHSDGLINIANDRRLLGEDQQSWISQLDFKPIVRMRSLNLMKRTLRHLVRISFDYFLPRQLKIWDILSLQPQLTLSASTNQNDLVLPWNTIEEDVTELLTSLKREEPLWFGSYKPEVLAHKICYENAAKFADRHS
jgi:hypothetical protein